MNQFNVFVDSLYRLYKENKIDEEKIVELFEGGKITEEEKIYILEARKGL